MLHDSLFRVRNASPDDISFYASMLRDKEWMNNSGFRVEDFITNEKILQFIRLNNNWDIKWVVINRSTDKSFGFCHFKQINNRRAETIGGIIKPLMNTIVSVSSYVQCIDWYFHLNRCQELLSVIYEKNTRSIKLNQSLGFFVEGERYYDTRHFYELILIKEKFYQSDVTKRFLKEL